MADLILVFVSASLVNNLVLHHLIGVVPGVALSRRVEVAAGISLVTIAVLAAATPITYALNRFLLRPNGLESLQLVVFVAAILALTLAGDAALERWRPAWHARCRVFIPLSLGNCAALGAALLNAGLDHGIFASVFFGLGAGAGFGAVLVTVAALHERILVADVPAPFRGTAVLLVALAILSMAFMGFAGLAKL